MKEIYCKFCGLELENGKCICKDSLSAEKTSKAKKKCDTCKKLIDIDSKYCPFCGIPIGESNYIPNLQKELKGDFEKDVLEDMKKEKKEAFEEKVNEIFTPGTKNVIRVLLSILIMLIIVKVVLIVKENIDNYNQKQYLESLEREKALLETKVTREIRETYDIDMTQQPVVTIHDNWLRQDGYYYCMDKNGDPIIDDWVIEEDEWGEPQKYYFDIDGRLVVNSWIDGEYYVGPDGAMWKDKLTPDGAYVGKDGRVEIDEEAIYVPVERETRVYYEMPNEKSAKRATNQKSSSDGVIKGVDATKTYELYIQEIKSIKDNYIDGENKCNITYYYPIIAGGKEKEVNRMNELIPELFHTRFRNILRGLKDENGKTPKTIILNTVDQRQQSVNRFIFLVSGKLIPQSGLSEKKKYRFIYDRKARELTMLDISD